MFKDLIELQRATVAARKACGVQGLGTRADGGAVQVVNVTMRSGKSAIVDPLSAFISIPAATEVMRQIEADKGWN